mmetsp:Transcript_4399/g.13918  ORF Transcript_4399/g.13918 Transcript_4399/m.13918 type:complete len:204 (+) Transcript_4399:1909-2520(+)
MRTVRQAEPRPAEEEEPPPPPAARAPAGLSGSSPKPERQMGQWLPSGGVTLRSSLEMASSDAGGGPGSPARMAPERRSRKIVFAIAPDRCRIRSFISPPSPGAAPAGAPTIAPNADPKSGAAAMPGLGASAALAGAAPSGGPPSGPPGAKSSAGAPMIRRPGGRPPPAAPPAADSIASRRPGGRLAALSETLPRRVTNMCVSI